MDWRCAAVLALVLPTVSQVSDILLARLTPDAIVAVELARGSVASPDGLWIPQRDTPAVLHVDAANNSAGKPIALAAPPCASITLSSNTVWAAICDASALARIDVKAGNVSQSVPLPIATPQGSVASAVKSLWVITDSKGVVTRVDEDTNTPVAEVYVAAEPSAIAADGDAIWVTSEAGNTLTRINAHTNVIVETIEVGPRPGLIAIGEDAVWTLNRGDGSVSRVDIKSNKVVHTIKVDAMVADGTIAAGEGAVWLSARGLPLVRIDPRTNRVTHRFAGDAGGTVVVGHGSIWISAAARTTWRLDPKLIAAMRP